jgi:hypothetical protein
MITSLFYHFAASCSGGDFLGFPKWYKYLPCQTTPDGLQTPQITQLQDVWLIVAAIIELMLRIAALAAVAFVIYGGVQYMTSQGDPGKTSQARGALLNAVTGLVIAILAASAVSFVAGRFK